MYLKRKNLLILIILIFSCCINNIYAQSQSLNIQNIANIKVDDLTDEQISEFWNTLQSKGLNISNLESEAKKNNMPGVELAKLKDRISKLSISNKVKTDLKSVKRNEPEPIIIEKVDEEKSKTFGAELFNNKNLTFEPNIKIATPQNYQLGPDDELLVDIYGYSEESFNLKVSPDGNIRIPLAGIVQVSGLTIEQAKIRIIKALSEIYDRINTGETKVSITLSNIRSIKIIIVGEASMPGTYTLSSLSTVFNALYASGGPNKNGSMRNIKVIRNNRTVATLDIYDFLLKGEAKGNIRLQDQDIIKVNPFENKVELTGEIKRTGYFEVLKTDNLKDLIYYAGGYTNNAYKEKIKVIRNTSKQKSIADIQQELFNMFTPQSGDVYLVDKLLERFENRVQIKGAVFRPGIYALDNKLTIQKLIQKAEGLKEDAFVTRAIIYRLKEDNSLSVLSVNLQDIKNGKATDIELQREDVVQIASKLELKQNYNLSINGEVLNPGEYPYAQNMKIEDLIIAAGGFKETAALTRVEVSRRKFDIDKMSLSSDIAIVKKFEVNKELSDDKNLKFELEPFDIVNIYTIAGYEIQKNVSIDGEVMYPGSYTIERNNEKVSDLIKRAGGLNATAFKDGIILLRKKNKDIINQIIAENKLYALKKQSKDSSALNDFYDVENATYDIVGLDVSKILKKPGSKADLLLRDGDVLKVPYEKQTVLVNGEVLYPIKVNVANARSLKGFVNNAGGFSSRALRRKAYVVYANGTVKATKNLLFVKFYPKVKPGCEIVIPKKEARKPTSLVEITTIATSLTTLVFLIITVTISK
jgi:protein involved in polysaccharide export with SLBB domain